MQQRKGQRICQVPDARLKQMIPNPQADSRELGAVKPLLEPPSRQACQANWYGTALAWQHEIVRPTPLRVTVEI
jgi:hypothetical protein